jgi:hypothetical protein
MIYISTSTSTTVVVDGQTYTVPADRAGPLIAAIKADDMDAVRKIVTLKEQVQQAFDNITINGGHVSYKGQPVDNYVVDLILNNPIDAEPIARFLNNVMDNPSRRAVQDLYKWCEKAKMPLTRDGHIIAYKKIREDFTDCHTGKFDNSPGKIVSVPRNEVDEDPDKTCSYGLHFCSADYLNHFGGARTVLVKVHPRDVVAFPRDYNLSKARCCRYEVLEEVGRKLDEPYLETHYVIQCIDDTHSVKDQYWKAEGYGYTPNLADAYHYTAEEAQKIDQYYPGLHKLITAPKTNLVYVKTSEGRYWLASGMGTTDDITLAHKYPSDVRVWGSLTTVPV